MKPNYDHYNRDGNDRKPGHDWFNIKPNNVQNQTLIKEA